ncbi:MAG TPA: ferritin-like domain-containing protein [Planctomycetota bacterium]|nr:ferritin-like domain-containing protein [Planctomycetota bacterium]
MKLLDFRPRFLRPTLPLDMFDSATLRPREEAARARRLEGLYHVGQEKAWDGRKVLTALVEKHGPIKVDDAKRRALAHVFSIIMWGELAAWKVSAQLAEQIVPLEAKMAATSQAHDEARHFYVMHDYLELLHLEPPPLEYWSRAVVEMAIDTPDLAQKLAGMHLQVETIALTIFHRVRELEIEPVLSELLLYYEKDEARHVGLGVQFLPGLMAKMNRVDFARFTAFQLKMLLYSLAGLKKLEPHLAVLGIDARDLILFGSQKQLSFLNELAREAGHAPMQAWAGTVFDVGIETLFPGRPEALEWSVRGAYERLKGAFDVCTGRIEGLSAPVRARVYEGVERIKEEKLRAKDRLPLAS